MRWDERKLCCVANKNHIKRVQTRQSALLVMRAVYLGKHILAARSLHSQCRRNMSVGDIFSLCSHSHIKVPPAMPRKDAIGVSQESKSCCRWHSDFCALSSLRRRSPAANCPSQFITSLARPPPPTQITVKSAAVNRVICILSVAQLSLVRNADDDEQTHSSAPQKLAELFIVAVIVCISGPLLYFWCSTLKNGHIVFLVFDARDPNLCFFLFLGKQYFKLVELLSNII